MAALIRDKEITPKELLELSFQQLKKANPSLNAVTHIRKEAVLQEATEVKIGNSPFAGVPFLLKDTQSQKGEKVTSGSKLLRTTIAQQDSNLVAKFREAGLLFMGHTNAPEFALKNITEAEFYGPTRNPWNLEHSPGGSSGGSAAMIASGVVPIAGASDGGGSIRIPASFSGLFGMKPTRGRTPVGPGIGRQWHGAAVDFILSRSVRDSAAMLNTLQVIQPEAAFQVPLYADNYVDTLQHGFHRPLKVGFTTQSPVGTPVSVDAKQAVEKTVKWLENEGHIVEEADTEVDGKQLMRNYFLMNSGEISTLFHQLEQSFGRALTAEDVEIEAWVLNEAGKSVSAAEFSASLASWDTAAAQMAKFHETYDFYITPATAFTAPKIGELTHSKEEQEQLRSKMSTVSKSKQQELIYDMFLPSLTYTPFTQLANLTGQPAMSVPVYLSKEGLPLGVQVVAPKGEEHRLLQLANQLEQSELWVGMNGNPYFKTI
jgi:amidase